MGMSTGRRGAWAYVRGAMGERHPGARPRGARARRRPPDRRGGRAGLRAKAVGRPASRRGTARRFTRGSSSPTPTPSAPTSSWSLAPSCRATSSGDIEAIQISSPVMKINLAIEELPRYRGARPARLRAGPDRRRLHRPHHRLHPARLSRTPVAAIRAITRSSTIHSQSAVDRSVAPEGKHTLSIFTQYFPYDLADGTWDERRDEIARHTLRPLRRVRPEHGRTPSIGTPGARPARHRGALRPDRRPHLPGRAGPRAGVRHAPGPRLHAPTKARSAASTSAAPAPGRAAA